MLKIGLIGWQEIWATYIFQIKHLQIVGFVDTHIEKSVYVTDVYGLKKYEHVEQLIEESDVLIVSMPLNSRYDIAHKIIRKGKHFFIDYPISSDIEKGEFLVRLIKEANVKCQIGFMEIFNPGYKQVVSYFQDIGYIEIKHCFCCNAKSIALNLLMDVLPQNIYLLMHTIKSPLKYIYANAINIITDGCDILNINLEFQNGCIATIAINKIHQHEIYTMDVWKPNTHIKINLQQSQSEILFFNQPNASIIKQDENKNYISNQTIFKSFSTHQVNHALDTFLNAIVYNLPTFINEIDGLGVLEICEEIKKQIIQKNQLLKF